MQTETPRLGRYLPWGWHNAWGFSPQSLKHILKCSLTVTAIFFQFKALPGHGTLEQRPQVAVNFEAYVM